MNFAIIDSRHVPSPVHHQIYIGTNTAWLQIGCMKTYLVKFETGTTLFKQENEYLNAYFLMTAVFLCLDGLKWRYINFWVNQCFLIIWYVLLFASFYFLLRV